MIRTFAVSTDMGGVAHDPTTGLTHRWGAPHALPGRRGLREEDVLTGPVIQPRELERSTPASLCWSPIVRCNLACPHCLDDTTVTEAGLASRRRVAWLLSRTGVLGVDISGGEPLLLRDLPDLARLVTAGGRTAVSVTTNGWHLARRAVDLVGAVDAVRVSFDGPTAADHDQLRGPGSFAHACEGIRTAVAAGLPVQLQTVVMASTAPHAQAIVDLAVDLGAGGVTYLQMLPIGAGAKLATAEAVDDTAARDLIAGLEVPAGLRMRLRTRDDAGGFTVIRADGQVWRNDAYATGIAGLRPFTAARDLTLVGSGEPS